jgi:hypothetical protein
MRGKEVGRRKKTSTPTAEDVPVSAGGSQFAYGVEPSRSFASSSTNSQSHFRARTRTNSTIDDSAGDERYIGGTSWDGPSFDSEEYQRQAKKHERRRYDTSTPTLIDEEDEEEMLQLNVGDASSCQGTGSETMRRTPGASMYKSSFSNEEDPLHMRRTHGALGAPQSADTTSNTGSCSDKRALRMGFDFALSSPPGAVKTAPAPDKTTKLQWQTYGSSTGRSKTESVKEKSESPRPFAFSPWARQPGVRTGSVSPNILRLTEDIGNLLHDEDDDDYAPEIPSVFSSDEGFDWTGSYTFDGHRQTRPAVPRTAPTLEKTRRRPAAEINNPKPRRHESFAGFVGCPTAS